MRDDFTKFSTIYQWFQTLIHPALMQRPISHLYRTRTTTRTGTSTCRNEASTCR
ncbi:MAG: hypothetical protein HRU34_16095 [Richelia sp.]|nr:hypothetical protein [Richelia sp.]